MGQKSNVLTLRKNNKNLNLQTQEIKHFLYGFKFLNSFEKLLDNKNIFLVKKNLNFSTNKIFLTLDLFYRTNKITIFKRRRLIKKTIASSDIFNTKNSVLSKLFDSQLKILKNTLLVLNFKNLNLQIEKTLLIFFYSKLKFFFNVLFTRRFNLFIDFLKISTLFFQSKVNSQSYLYFLGQIFRILPKRRHTRFLFFLKYLFKLLLDNIAAKSSIKGIKFIVHGKLQGKTRATSCCIQAGAVPIQSLDKNIEFARTHVYTLYGVFGFQMWVCRNF